MTKSTQTGFSMLRRSFLQDLLYSPAQMNNQSSRLVITGEYLVPRLGISWRAQLLSSAVTTLKLVPPPIFPPQPRPQEKFNNDNSILLTLTDILLLSGSAVEAADVVDAGLGDLGGVPDVPHLEVLNIPVLSTKPHPLGLDEVVAGVSPGDDFLLNSLVLTIS